MRGKGPASRHRVEGERIPKNDRCTFGQRGFDWSERLAYSLKGLGANKGRMLLREAERRLALDPLIESRTIKTLQPNEVAERQLRLWGKYRILFNVDHSGSVTLVVVGIKRGSVLFVAGRRFNGIREFAS